MTTVTHSDTPASRPMLHALTKVPGGGPRFVSRMWAASCLIL